MIRKRVGMTLIELLVTLSIVVAIAAIVLPSVKTLLLDRRSTQAATLVRNFIESAQARAIGSNNYVSVVLERVSSIPLDQNEDGFYNAADMVGAGTLANPYRFRSATAIDPIPVGAPLDSNFVPYNTCVRLSMAERPRPRSHTLMGPIWVGDQIVRTDGSAYTGGGGPHPQAGRLYFQISSTDILRDLLTFQMELVPGSEISFGTSSSRFLITEVIPGGNTGTNFWFTCVGSNSTSDTDELAIPSSSPTGAFPEFTIYPKPKPISSKVLLLPRTMCIDLSLSGFADQGSIGGGRDRRARFSSDWLYVTSVPGPQELRPIYIEFGPEGTLSTVFANGRDGLAATSVPVQSVEDLFLHIGKIDQVRKFTTLADGVGTNLFDERTYIVRVSGKSSTITTAPAADVLTQAELLGIPLSEVTISEALRLTRQSVLGQQLTGQ